MTKTPPPVTYLAALGAGLAVAAITYRGTAAVVRVAVRELDYRAGDLDTWLRRLT